MSLPKTNAGTYQPAMAGTARPEWVVLAEGYLRRASRHLLRREVDDYNWRTYEQFYGPQNVTEEKHYTHDLGELDYRLVDGRLYTLADAKPVNAWHRVLWEAVVNLPDIASVHEVGAGGGKLIVNLGRLLGREVTLGACDLGAGQLSLFQRRWPIEHRAIAPFQHDITVAPLPAPARADVVYTATVLMHIKRRQAYLSAIENLRASAKKYLVVLENWGAHDYVADMREVLARSDDKRPSHLYFYDSGAVTAMVVSLVDQALPPCFSALETDAQLRKYG